LGERPLSNPTAASSSNLPCMAQVFRQLMVRGAPVEIFSNDGFRKI
jgi:hypothetical protein